MTGPYPQLAGPAGAPVVVLGSSLGTSTAMWRSQLPALTERYRVIRVEHPGHGGPGSSPVADEVRWPCTIDTLGARLLRVLDDLAVERVSYAGLSLGGMLGMWLATRAPDRVDALALLCTAAYLPPADQWRQRAATVRTAGLAAIADAVVARWFTPGFAMAHPEVVATHRTMLTSVQPDGYAACCEAIAELDLRDDLTRIVAPTLVIAGADDPATPPEHARQIAASVPGARLEVLADAAHLANVEQSDRVTRLLLDHLPPVAT